MAVLGTGLFCMKTGLRAGGIRLEWIGLESIVFQVPNADLGCPSLIRAVRWVRSRPSTGRSACATWEDGVSYGLRRRWLLFHQTLER